MNRFTLLLLLVLFWIPLAASAEGEPAYEPHEAHAEADGNGDGMIDRAEFHERMVEIFFHGDRDRIVPFELGRRLFAAAPEPKAFETIAGQPYYLRVGVFPGAPGGPGAFTIAYPSLGADDCVNATPIGGLGAFPFDNGGASMDGPDHEACFFAGLRNYAGELGRPWRPRKVAYALTMTEVTEVKPAFVVDITAFWETKLRAIAVYESQWTPPPGETQKLPLDLFRERVELAGRRHGERIGVTYGEGFVTREPLVVDDLLTLGGESL